MEKQKIVFFDIDGTLIDPKTNFEIPESALQAIRKIQKEGHLAVINTGRTASFMEKCIMEAGFDAFILGCGTQIVYKGEELLHVSLPSETVERLIDALRKFKIDGVLEGKEKCYFDYNRVIYDEEFRELSKAATYIRDDFEHVGIVDKLFVRKGEYSDFEGFHDEFKKDLQFIDRGNGFYELIPFGYSKATGIEFLVSYLRKKAEEENLSFMPSLETTYSIGDSTNDLSMLLATKVSIAMGNSMSELFDKVTYVTKNVEDDGILYAIEHFVLQVE